MNSLSILFLVALLLATPRQDAGPLAPLPALGFVPPLPGVVRGKPRGYRLVALPENFIVSDSSQAINDRTEIVGYIDSKPDGDESFRERRAAVWRKTGFTLFPDLKLAPAQDYRARAINNRGDIVIDFEGHFSQENNRSSPVQTLLVSRGGAPESLKNPSPNGTADITGFQGVAIDDQGDLAGAVWYQHDIDPRPLAEGNRAESYATFRAPSGSYARLLAGGCRAMNERGVLVGFQYGPTQPGNSLSDTSQAYCAIGGKVTVLGPGEAIAVNNRGDIVCDTNTLTSYIAKTEGGATYPLTVAGLAKVHANAINDRREIVGCAGSIAGNPFPPEKNRAFLTGTEAILWRGGTAYRLAPLVTGAKDWQLTSAIDINNRGEIVGIGNYKGKKRGFLLMPVSSGPKP